jgi:acyl-CoA reductase-like NAD-dependent aldehyde dehydrogenase
MVVGDATVGASPTMMAVINPATETVVGHAPVATEASLDAAVSVARAAFPAWRATAIAERRQRLCALADVIDADRGYLAPLLTSEQGKPLKSAHDEVARAAQWLRDVATIDLPQHIDEDTPQRLSITTYVPIGVVGAIVPWNYPVLLAAWKIAPALLCGNTLIVKPSPYTPLTMLRIGELARNVFPDGVFSVITGDDRLGPWMSAHPDIDKISFTGSTETGRKVMASAAPTLKRLTLELGGNDAAIVLPDADLATIIPALFAAAFGNSGQICLATKRLYVHADLFDRVVAGFEALIHAARVGNGADPQVAFGPIQNRAQYERVRAIMADSLANGHDVRSGSVPASAKGYFIPLTIMVDPPETSRVVVEEAFGPVLPILRYHNIDDAISRANASPYALGASIWSSDIEAARALAPRLEAGTVWINETRYVSPATTLAGHKQSGLGAEHGIDGLISYCQPQTITLRL